MEMSSCAQQCHAVAKKCHPVAKKSHPELDSGSPGWRKRFRIRSGMTVWGSGMTVWSPE